MQKNRFLIAVLGSVLLLGVAIAQPAPRWNLASARNSCRQALNKVSAAEKADEFDMEGHAKKAKALLEEACKELEAAYSHPK